MTIAHDVLIAGGGPTGLMLAAELALAGIDVAIVERRETQALAGSRAGGLHARTLEVLDQRGVAERFLAEGKIAQVATFATLPLDMSDLPTRFPHGLALFQNHIERILFEWVASLPVRFHRGREVIGFASDADGVTVELGGGETLRAKYLVGCDGGRSLVRKKAGIEFVGWDASTSYLIAEVEMTEAPAPSLRRDEKGTYAIGPIGDGRVRVVLRDEAVSQDDAPTLDELRAALVALYGTDFGLTSASWLSRFSDATRQAASYRAGRVLLAGDAAHVHSPAGGQGLNLGVQDAVNLGWKLAQVVRGVSDETLLDTYHAERHPVAARALAGTMASTALGRSDARTEALRASLTELFTMDAPRRKYAAIASGLDVHYDLGAGHPLLGRRMPDLELSTEDGPRRVFSMLLDARPLFLDLGAGPMPALDGFEGRLRRVRAEYTGPWELPVVGAVAAPTAVLVRPDGYVGWVGEGSDAGLESALARWLGAAKSVT